MRRIVILILFIIPSLGGANTTPLYSIGAGPGAGNLLGGRPPWFTISPLLQCQLEARLKGHWFLALTFASGKNYDDSSARTNFKFGSDKNTRSRSHVSRDLILTFKYRKDIVANELSLFGGFGGGISIWAFKDKEGESILPVEGPHGETVNFSATEIIIGPSVGLEYQLSARWRLSLESRISYLTGAGSEFAEAVEDARPPWKAAITVNLNYLFGGRSQSLSQNDERRHPAKQQSEERDTISTIIGQNLLAAPTVPKPASSPPVAPQLDSDNDGIPDFSDFCPGTESAVRGKIDINGCPIDTDCDGIPDYRDRCPDNIIGGIVDKEGCPIDSDGDGVPDGLDDCPGSVSGLTVNSSGCLDDGIFAKAIIIPVRYRPGSFELDPGAISRLDTLALAMKVVTTAKMQIYGYGDDSGNTEENLTLSQKRANRVKDYLVSRGIAGDRLTPTGRGPRPSNIGDNIELRFNR
ncbi:hypothetical protein TRIP_C90457 [Candidatus Zixiibacteriota bacterium]|nr:hypothetical protein TRIP_C90457 [candidate division Zixibacteria bacterium]